MAQGKKTVRPPAVAHAIGRDRDYKAEKLEKKIAKVHEKANLSFDDLNLPDTLPKEVVKEAKNLFESLKNINVLVKSDLFVFKMAVERFAELYELKKTYEVLSKKGVLELKEQIKLLEKISRLSYTIYQLLSKYFVTPEDRFDAMLQVAREDKKQSAVNDILED